MEGLLFVILSIKLMYFVNMGNKMHSMINSQDLKILTYDYLVLSANVRSVPKLSLYLSAKIKK